MPKTQGEQQVQGPCNGTNFGSLSQNYFSACLDQQDPCRQRRQSIHRVFCQLLFWHHSNSEAENSFLPPWKSPDSQLSFIMAPHISPEDGGVGVEVQDTKNMEPPFSGFSLLPTALVELSFKF